MRTGNLTHSTMANRSTVLFLLFLLGCRSPVSKTHLDSHYAALQAELRQDPSRAQARIGELEQFDERPEWADMAAAILKDEWLDLSRGWWRPGRSRWDWTWLRDRFDTDKDGHLEKNKLPDAEAYFDRMDYDRNGRLEARDLDWSTPDKLPRLGDTWFHRLDLDANGQITLVELNQFFNQADSLAAGFLDQDDFRVAGISPEPDEKEMPSPEKRLSMLLAGELGSLQEGPQLNDLAPDFKLQSHDGKLQAGLAGSRGKKPVVLIFGSFT